VREHDSPLQLAPIAFHVALQTDSIVALSTPPGRSGIGIVRISGPDSLSILQTLVAPKSFWPQPNLLSLKTLNDPSTGQTLDQALICFFKAPHSFTGEDVVEMHCHGSPVLLRHLIDTILKLNARLADPGEFSLRAVNNGRLQLTEAEAIRDLIDAQTDAALLQATRQMKGEISHRLRPAKEALLRIIVRLESSLEFVEEDLPTVEYNEIINALQELGAELSALAETFSRGRLLRDGLKVAFVGRPNVGKSSLFNSLLGQGRAIVTEIPGTTRDTISESIALDGVPVTLIDTAGIRASTDQIESIGVERTRRAAADADLLIVVVDGSQPLLDEDQSVLAEVEKTLHVLAVNKSDLASFSLDRLDSHLSRANRLFVFPVSAKTLTGLEGLRAAILKPFDRSSASNQGLLITNARHHDLLLRTADAIEYSERLIGERASEELVLVGLHNALRYLGDITGETTANDILGQIFSTFCIGK
jgi:tRNA modification GTPase